MYKSDYQEIKFARRQLRIGRFKTVIAVIFFICLAVGFFNIYKPLQKGLSYEGDFLPTNSSDVFLLSDLTYQDSSGGNKKEHQIFDTIFNYIDKAEQYILVDAFLFNDYQGKSENYRNLAKELSDKLIAKKINNPKIKIDVIIDPINSCYGSELNEIIKKLQTADVNVIITKLTKLRDSNPIVSAPWRVFVAPFGNSNKAGFLPNPFSRQAPNVTLRSYLALLNAKANHRKVFLVDNNDRLISVISSANPHGPSSANSNMAWLIKGSFGLELYESESYVALLSDQSLSSMPENLKIDKVIPENSFVNLKLLTEKSIKNNILDIIESTKFGDRIDLAMFYLSDFDISKALVGAANRNVNIRLVLDENKNAFGHEKNGVPNKVVADYLHKKSKGKIQLKWYKTIDEQFHTKTLAVFFEKNKEVKIISGSANFTRRNLENYNLESDVFIVADNNSSVYKNINNYFETIWNNSNNKNYTINYDKNNQAGILKFWQYYIQESLGLGTF